MSRLIGYICNDDTLTHRVVERVREELDDGSEADDLDVARGFGWIREGQALLRKQPPPGVQSGGLGDVLADIRAREVVGHERAAEGGPYEAPELQPFSLRTWVFAQSDSSSGIDAYYDTLLASIPDHIRRNIDGESDEELVFHRFMSALYERGGFGYSESNPEACVESMTEAISAIEQLAADDEAGPDLALGNAIAISERLLIATRFQEPMYYRVFDGLKDEGDEPLFAGHSPQGEAHEHSRGVLVLNGIEPHSEDWESIPERSLLWVGSDWEAHVEPMETSPE